MALAPTSSQPLDKLTGLIDRVTYFNEETGFAVLKVQANVEELEMRTKSVIAAAYGEAEARPADVLRCPVFKETAGATPFGGDWGIQPAIWIIDRR
jgi:hypothetical protein